MNFLRKLSSLSQKISVNHNHFNNARLLYSPASLKINEFIQTRQEKRKQGILEGNDLRKKLKEVCEEGSNVMLFPNDISNLVYVAEDLMDLELIHKLLIRLKSQKLVKVQPHSYGTLVMKLHYIMNKPQEAMKLIENPILYPEFKSSTSFVLLLDLLYKNNYFEEIIKMYNIRLTQSNVTYFTPIHVIFFAACYKLNTKESFNSALNVWQILVKNNYTPGVRLKFCFAALSLNQGQYYCAMEVLPQYLIEGTSESLRCMILTKSKRFGDAIENLKKISSSKKEKMFILQEVLDVMEKEINESNGQHKEEFQTTKKELVENNKVKDLKTLTVSPHIRNLTKAMKDSFSELKIKKTKL